MYTKDLMSLNTHANRMAADSCFASIKTPLNRQAWTKNLSKHPDKDYVHYLLNGIEHGFQIGADESYPFRSAGQNMLSAKQNPDVIEQYITKENVGGNILGPFTQGMAGKIHINRFGVIPKKHQPGKWRLITDLSFPEGHSINDAISSDLCSLSYVTVNEVAKAAISLGKGAQIAKIDIKSAYRLIPVCAYDRKWLGMRWKDQVFVDGMLPFGLRSAPKIFNALADALEWIVGKRNVKLIFHYLDDFAVIGPPDSPACQQALDTLEQVCKELGVPLAPEKKDGPSTLIVFLGILIDTIKQELSLPGDKLRRLLEMVVQWEHKKACTRRELESLIGTLHHACIVIPAGRSFMRRAISLLSVARKRHHHIRLNREMRSDLMWWKVFASTWNGSSLIVHNNSDEAHVTSDASGSWGCGAWHGSKWFQLPWEQSMSPLHIAAKELIPIIVAAAIWGQEWKGKRVISHCDNMAVVAVINSRYSKDEYLMHMLRCLFFIEAHHQFLLSAVHIAGVKNTLADSLSRNKRESFLAEIRHCDHEPSPIPCSLMQLLLHPQLDWTSPNWTALFNSSVRKE